MPSHRARGLVVTATVASLLSGVCGCSYSGKQAAMVGVGAFELLRARAFSGGMSPVAAGGWDAVARDDGQSGDGGVLAFGFTDEVQLMEVSLSVLSLDDATETEITRLQEALIEKDGRGLALTCSLLWHVGTSGEWGLGMGFGYGAGAFREKMFWYVMPQVRGWLGEDDNDDFAAGAEAALRAVAGVRF